ncbi:MAG: response regulator [Opitutaceae bacterium]|nr:response regulator [Cytophagales bacterium]
MKRPDFILLVDDDQITNYLTQRLLTRLNPSATVRIANNGEEALRIIKETADVDHISPDLILLDVNMPVMNGIEFMSALTESDYRDHSRIVAVTTSSNKNDFAALRKYGIDEIILKPLTPSRMAELMAE